MRSGFDSRFYRGNFSLKGEDSRGDHGLGRLVEFRFKGLPGTYLLHGAESFLRN